MRSGAGPGRLPAAGPRANVARLASFAGPPRAPRPHRRQRRRRPRSSRRGAARACSCAPMQTRRCAARWPPRPRRGRTRRRSGRSGRGSCSRSPRRQGCLGGLSRGGSLPWFFCGLGCVALPSGLFACLSGWAWCFGFRSAQGHPPHPLLLSQDMLERAGQERRRLMRVPLCGLPGSLGAVSGRRFDFSASTHCQPRSGWHQSPSQVTPGAHCCRAIRHA